MEINELALRGCFEIVPKIFEDDRGSFVKVFHEEFLANKGIMFSLREEFYSSSKKDVFRGLHFQHPPFAHNKIVYCTQGAVVDFLVDLRKESSTFKQSVSVELNETNKKALFIPVGIAHGFLSLKDNSIMVYKTDSVYSPEHDSGVLYSSCDLENLPMNLIVSKRDNEFSLLNDYESPF